MPLTDWIYGKNRRPTATVRLNGSAWGGIISLSRRQEFGSGVSSGLVVGRNPPVTPTIGMGIYWTWGYNGEEVVGFTGDVTQVEKLSYPDRWQLTVQDPLYRADQSSQDIATDPLNDIPASDAVEYILSHYGGLTRLDIPTLAASGSAWGGSEWVLGTLTPVEWTGTTALKAAQEICGVLGYWLYCDAGGTIRARLMERKPSGSARRNFTRGVDLLIEGAPVRTQSYDTIRNRVVVTGAATGVEGANVTDAYQTAHPLLPDGVYRELQFSSDLIEYVNESEAGNASCAGVAKRLVALHSRRPNVIRARVKADPLLQVGATVGIQDSGVGLTAATKFFVYSLETTLEAASGRFDQQLVLDGGTGSSGYTTIPEPEASFTWDIYGETLDGTGVVEVVVDGSASYSAAEGEIVDWAWSTTATTYGGTPDTGTGKRFTFVIPASEGEAAITLTVTDTTSKTASVSHTISLTGDSLATPRTRVLHAAFGSVWYVTPNGGETWRTEATASTVVPPLSAGVDERAPADALTSAGLITTGIKKTLDILVTPAIAGATLDPDAIWQNEANPLRVWAAVGDTVYRSTDGGDTFTTLGKPRAGSDVAWIMEDPAVENSVFALVDADFVVTTNPALSSWPTLYEGPAGATARQFVRSKDGQITWVCYTGTFTGSHAHRVETGATAILPSGAEDVEIRTLALDKDASTSSAATLYLIDDQDPARIFSCDGITGLGGAQLTPTLPAGETVQHMLADPDIPLLYIATFGATAGALHKYFIHGDTLAKFLQGQSGEQAHMIGIGPLVRPPVIANMLMVGDGGVVTGVWRFANGGWVDVSGDLPDQGWRGVIVNPVDVATWIVWDMGSAYITTNEGVNWTEITNIAPAAGNLEAGLGLAEGIVTMAWSADGTRWAAGGSGGVTFLITESGFVCVGENDAGLYSTYWPIRAEGTDQGGFPQAMVWAGTAVIVSLNHKNVDEQCAAWVRYAGGDEPYSGYVAPEDTARATALDRYGVATVYGLGVGDDGSGTIYHQLYRVDDARTGTAYPVLTRSTAFETTGIHGGIAAAVAGEDVYVISATDIAGPGIAGLWRFPVNNPGDNELVIDADGIFVTSDKQTHTALACIYNDGASDKLAVFDGQRWYMDVTLPGVLGDLGWVYYVEIFAVSGG